MRQLFASGDQSIGASASASVLSMNIEGWFPLGLTGLISLLSKNLLHHHRWKASVLWHLAFFIVQLAFAVAKLLSPWGLEASPSAGKQRCNKKEILQVRVSNNLWASALFKGHFLHWLMRAFGSESPFTSFVASGKFLNPSESRVPHLQKGIGIDRYTLLYLK